MGIEIDLRTRNRSGELAHAVRGPATGQFVGEVFGLMIGQRHSETGNEPRGKNW